MSESSFTPRDPISARSGKSYISVRSEIVKKKLNTSIIEEPETKSNEKIKSE